VPDGETTYTDLLRGEITVDNSTIDDQVLLKSNGYPTYHLAVVVDDHLMEISLVTRAEEWLPSTPKHVMLYDMLGWERPQYLHYPMLVDAQRRKLSKRAMDVSVQSIIDKGYLPEALINFCALLGWHPADDQEVLSLTEIVDRFDLDHLQKGAAFFDMEKLTWINAQYIRRLPIDELTQRVLPLLKASLADDGVRFGERVIPLSQFALMLGAIQDRLQTFADVADALTLFFEVGEYDADLLIRKSDRDTTRQVLSWSKEMLADLTKGDFSVEKIKDHFLHKIEAIGQNRGVVLWPLRVALTGRERSPDVFAVAAALGPDEVNRRLDFALAKVA